MPKIVDHDQRRRELAQAAWNVIADSGIDGATTREIAREAGYSTGVLAHYFERKDDILLEALHMSHATIKRRMMRRMAVNGKRSLGSYLQQLKEDEGEVQALFRDLLINVTSFFRDPSLFDAIKTVVMPALTADRPPGDRCPPTPPGR